MTEQGRRVVAEAAEVDADAAEWEGLWPRGRADNAFVRNVDRRFHT